MCILLDFKSLGLWVCRRGRGAGGGGEVAAAGAGDGAAGAVAESAGGPPAAAGLRALPARGRHRSGACCSPAEMSYRLDICPLIATCTGLRARALPHVSDSRRCHLHGFPEMLICRTVGVAPVKPA